MQGEYFELGLMKFGRFSSLHHQPHLRTHIQPKVVLLLREGAIDMHFEHLLSPRQDWRKDSIQNFLWARITRQQPFKIFTPFLDQKIRLYISYVNLLGVRKLSLNFIDRLLSYTFFVDVLSVACFLLSELNRFWFIGRSLFFFFRFLI